MSGAVMLYFPGAAIQPCTRFPIGNWINCRHSSPPDDERGLVGFTALAGAGTFSFRFLPGIVEQDILMLCKTCRAERSTIYASGLD